MRVAQALITSLCLVAVFAPAHANPVEAAAWRLESSGDGIEVYTRTEPASSFRATRAVMTIEASLASSVALLQDTAACHEWVPLCAESSVLKRVSDAEQVVYTRSDLPWPVADRDSVSQVQWSRSADGHRIDMVARSAPDFIPRREGVLRFAKADSIWRLIEQANGTVRVEMQAHVEPGGAIPSWLSNAMVVDSPRQMLQNMRRLLGEGRYRNAGLPSLPARSEPVPDDGTALR